MIHFRQYIFLAFFIYLLTIFLSCLIYLLLIFLEKYSPLLTLYIYSFGDLILNGFDLFSRPLRYFLPNRTNDEYYLILINTILSIFAFIYAYLFYLIRPELFSDISSIPNTAYLQWLDNQRRRFQESRRAA